MDLTLPPVADVETARLSRTRATLEDLNKQYGKGLTYEEFRSFKRLHKKQGARGYIYVCRSTNGGSSSNTYRIGPSSSPIKRTKQFKNFRLTGITPVLSMTLTADILNSVLDEYRIGNERETFDVHDYFEEELVDTCRYYCQVADLIMRNIPVQKFDINKCTATDLRMIYGISRRTADEVVDVRPIKSYADMRLGDFRLSQLKQFTFIDQPEPERRVGRHKHSSSIQLVLRDREDRKDHKDVKEHKEHKDLKDPKDYKNRPSKSNVNKATESDIIDAVGGINRRLAQRIVLHRRLCPFKSMDEVARIDGVTTKRLNGLKHYFSV